MGTHRAFVVVAFACVVAHAFCVREVEVRCVRARTPLERQKERLKERATDSSSRGMTDPNGTNGTNAQAVLRFKKVHSWGENARGENGRGTVRGRRGDEATRRD